MNFQKRGKYEVTEFELVCECIDAIQGIEGKLIKWKKQQILVKNELSDDEYSTEEDEEEEDDEEDEEEMRDEESSDLSQEKELCRTSQRLEEVERYSFQVESNDIHPAHKTLVSKIVELGNLYINIQNYLKSNQHLHKENKQGLVSQCFDESIQTELVEYFRSIALLSVEPLTIPTSTYTPQPLIDSQTHTTNNNNNNNHHHNNNIILENGVNEEGMKSIMMMKKYRYYTNLTLRRLYVWSISSLRKLSILAMLCSAIEGKKGGEIVSIIYSYTLHGDPAVSNFVNNILSKTIKPIIDMTSKWIMEGYLEDPHSEFFVGENKLCPIDKLWDHKYFLREEMKISFWENKLLEKILRIGKSLNFMKECCKEFDWRENFVWVDHDHGAKLKYNDSLLIRKLVDHGEKIINKTLVSIMLDKYKLIQHCVALKRYFFFESGDFGEALITELFTELDKKGGELYRHNLLSSLESAIRNSNIVHDDATFLQKLDVKIKNANEIGWDVFCLTYSTTMPLSTVFTAEIFEKYQKIFHFILRLKRIKFSLSKTRATYPLRRFGNKLMWVHVLHNAMYMLAQSVHSYLILDVINECWQKFTLAVSDATNLDLVILAHNEIYIDTIMKKCMLSAVGADLYLILNKIVDITLHFSSLENVFFRNLSRSLDLNKKRKSLYKSPALDDANLGDRDKELNRLRELGDHFHQLLDEFKIKLSEQTLVDLKFHFG